MKANIGHLEAGAGIAGLIKSVLVLENGVLPPSAGFEKHNSEIPVNEWNLNVTRPNLIGAFFTDTS